MGKKEKKPEPDTTVVDDHGENDIEDRLPIWEQATLGGALAVTYARAEMMITPVRIMFGPARTLEGLGYNVPEFALKGKKVPIGGKMCALLFQSGSKETILAHGSVISSIAELAKTWSEKGSSGWEENGCDVIEKPKELEERTYQVLKGEGQYGQLWLERVK